MGDKADSIFALFCIFCTVVAVHSEAPGLKATCGLVDIPINTSPTNLYSLPPVADNVASGINVWRHGVYGSLKKTTVNPISDHKYMGAIRGTLDYTINTNDLTNTFTKIEKRRQMTRYITFTCADDSVVRYYFTTLMQDVTPPRFYQEEYTFDITSDWAHQRPISEGQFVIVSDDAFELGTDSSFGLTFGAVPDIVTIQPWKLWAETNQDWYAYRLDIFLREGEQLSAGDAIQVIVSAKDTYNTGNTKININVS